MDKYEIGAKLKSVRIRLNINQVDIAKLLDTTVQKVSSFETGRTRIDLETFIKLCKYYNISSDNFFNLNSNNDVTSETSLLSNFRQLNQEGQDKVLEYIQLLIKSGQYIKSRKSAMVD